LTSAVIDAPLVVLAVAFVVEPALFPPGSVPSWLRPSLALGIRQSLPTEIAALGGSTEFLWTAGNLRLCPLGFPERSIVVVRICAEMDLGRLGATARGFDAASQGSFAWLDFQGSAFATFSITDHVFVTASGAFVVPYSRRRFELSNGAEISRAPAVGALASLGIGLRF
jgi:hypothetical protein